MWRNMFMKGYEKTLLNKLVDRYENSQLYLEQPESNRAIHLPFTKKTLPSYFNDESNEYEQITISCQVLEEKNWISIQWQNKKIGYIIERITLNLENLGTIYAYLQRTPKRSQAQEIMTLLANYKGKYPLLDYFITYIEERLHANLSVAKYFNLEDKKGLETLLIAVEGVLSNLKECYVREFSMQLFGDSKTFEALMGKVCSIFQTFSAENEWLEGQEQLLAEYNIFKNPTYVMLKGCGKLQMGETIIPLKDLPHGIGINSKDLGALQVIRDEEVKEVITIENLTAFNRFNKEKALLIYLGGYHNGARRALLMRIDETYKSIPFYHWGDIDCGGLKIFKDLVDKTHIPFQPLYMDTETLINYEAYGKALTLRDQENLEKIRKNEAFSSFYSLIDTMKEKGLKLEQEIVAYELMK